MTVRPDASGACTAAARTVPRVRGTSARRDLMKNRITLERTYDASSESFHGGHPLETSRRFENQTGRTAGATFDAMSTRPDRWRPCWESFLASSRRRRGLTDKEKRHAKDHLFLWFNDKAEEPAKFTSRSSRTRRRATSRAVAGARPEGSVMTAAFVLDGGTSSPSTADRSSPSRRRSCSSSTARPRRRSTGTGTSCPRAAARSAAGCRTSTACPGGRPRCCRRPGRQGQGARQPRHAGDAQDDEAGHQGAQAGR